jgi:hypothetical protein
MLKLSAEELRPVVTSKGAPPEAALETFHKEKLPDTMVQDMLAAFQRARQLALKERTKNDFPSRLRRIKKT